MFIIEKVSNNIAFKIADTLDLDIDKQDVIAYGAFSLIQTIWSIVLVMIFGALFNVFWQSMLISFSGAFLRKYCGGAHATSPNRCAVIGVIIYVGNSLILDKILSYRISAIYILIYACITFIFTYYVICKYSPVDTPNKRIVKEETKRRLRKSAFKLIHCYVVIIIILYLYYIKEKNYTALIVISSISTGVLWQDITLFSIGHYIMSKLDIILKNISGLAGGEKV